MRKPILITHTYRCSACGSTDTQVYNSLIDGKAVEPVLPKGWRDYGQEGYFCPAHILELIEHQTSCKVYQSFEYEPKDRKDRIEEERRGIEQSDKQAERDREYREEERAKGRLSGGN